MWCQLVRKHCRICFNMVYGHDTKADAAVETICLAVFKRAVVVADIWYIPVRVPRSGKKQTTQKMQPRSNTLAPMDTYIFILSAQSIRAEALCVQLSCRGLTTLVWFIERFLIEESMSSRIMWFQDSKSLVDTTSIRSCHWDNRTGLAVIMVSYVRVD